MSKLNTIHPDLRDYALKLRAAGFTVYGSERPRLRADRSPVPLTFFIYELDGCFGTIQRGHWTFPEYEHHMPITPGLEDGSAIIVGGTWGDKPTLGIDQMDRLSVEYARAVARPENRGLVTGKVHRNAQPWGIGTTYTPLEGED